MDIHHIIADSAFISNQLVIHSPEDRITNFCFLLHIELSLKKIKINDLFAENKKREQSESIVSIS